MSKSVAVDTGNSEVVYETPASVASSIRFGTVLLIVYFTIFLYVLVVVGPGLLIAFWPPWVLIGAFGLVQLLIFLQRNRFGVYLDGIAPTYRPWGLWSPKRLIIPADRLKRVEIRTGGEPDEVSPDPSTYFLCVLELRDGMRIVIPSHGGYRSLHRQLRSDARVKEAGQAIQQFAARLPARETS